MLQGNILSEILDSHKRYSLEDPDNNNNNKSKNKKLKKSNQIPVNKNELFNNSMITYDADVAFSISIPKAHAVADPDSMLGTSHIEYDIEITRTTDNETHKITKRFRDINEFYDSLLKSELVTNTTDLIFPSKALLGFNESNDPNSNYIKKRKVDLQSFLRKLFGLNPFLFDHPKVYNYLELFKFSFEPKTTSRFANTAPQLNAVIMNNNALANKNIV